jgi:hypothetical protein
MNYLTITSSAILALTLTACATDKTMFYKDGQVVHVLSCSGPTFTGCMEKASKICQSSGYDILDRASVRQSGFVSATEIKELVIACRKTPGAASNPITVAPVSVESKREGTPASPSNPSIEK